MYDILPISFGRQLMCCLSDEMPTMALCGGSIREAVN
jgi:hypothetical protein